MEKYDLIIVGAGPGGLAGAITAQQLGLSYLVVEKGKRVFQGIIDSYPRGKKVYPTIPKGEDGPYPLEDLAPSLDNKPVEEYVAQIEACVDKHRIAVRLSEEFQNIVRDRNDFVVATSADRYRAAHVVLAFGSNIPGDLGIYGEAKAVARSLDSPEEHIGAPTLVLGGGNAAADIVATLSKVKRAAGDLTTVHWAHRAVQFKVDKDVARDLGEEILLGGNIRILPGAIPQIGEVDEDGVERLIIQTQKVHMDGGVELHQGMSFPMKHVIACIGTQGPAPMFASLGLQQIICTEGVCKISKEGAQLLMLTPELQTSIKGVYAIGGAISPAYILVSEKGVLREQKHTNLIYTAVKDGVRVVESIARQKSST